MKNIKYCISFLLGLSLIITNINILQAKDTVRLVFVHHSTGRYWLNTGHGNLGDSLAAHNYYVRDTDYGWDAPYNTNIGDKTDIGQWYSWFADSTMQDNGKYQCDNITEELFSTNTKYASYNSPIADPGGENEIIMFKSCFPNSNVRDDNGTSPEELFGQPYNVSAHTLDNCKAVYNEILEFFKNHPDKMFMVITQPPLTQSSTNETYAANARLLTNWLTLEWLQENNWENKNVYVFNYFNILTDENNHHRLIDGIIEHINNNGDNYAYYPTSSSDSHPNAEGDQKATVEFISLLDYFYEKWQQFLNPENPNEPPEFLSYPDTISFNEDDSIVFKESRWYDFVVDNDTPDSLLRFDLLPTSYINVKKTDDNFVLTAKANWFGVQSLKLIVSDGEYSDTTIQTIRVLPVNDPPEIINLPEIIEFPDTTIYKMDMAMHIFDLDTPDSLLSWEFSVSNDSIVIEFDEQTNILSIIGNGFLGEAWLTCILKDNFSAADTGIVKVEINKVVNIEDYESLKPKTYHLMQNFPNPFNPVTKIRFGVPVTGENNPNLQISIYDTQGKKIKTIISGVFTPGSYQVEWDGTNEEGHPVGSGIYIYRLESSEFIQARKMMLIR